ncbi:protoporphyrinogen oxidase [Alteribacillus iranensis]|uniref:Coproporphyrinogen III oxidase n=1 Tax=Alteribacillus iranensis TaxID=930128 RepID=A0A1I1Z8M2_9BACI|nr:protoporphyrinogen oxidase [Alteribacillus iranensis]SFE26853.1 oxygen-dependent protoporphyrinogen oxidase [Alteribacillus iranensis]
MRVAIIGGGITGLSAAYYLQKEILANQLDVEYQLFEGSPHLGGKIQTHYYKDFVIEKGPDSFLARKTSAYKLVKEVGLEEELVTNRTGQAYVLSKEELHPIPMGAVMGIPTKLGPFLTTNLFSPAAKVRASADLILPKSKADGDQSLGRFFRRRLGSEVVDNLIDPLLSGIYAGDIDRLSLQSTFPQFQEVEKSHRSLILGMKGTRPPTAQGKQTGGFLTLRRGLQSLVDAIENHLDEDAVQKDCTLQKITRKSDQYELEFQDGSKRYFDKIIITTPPHITASLLGDEEIQDHLRSIPSTSVATVAMAFDESQLTMDFDGTGFVVSKKGDYTITACTWTHRKWEHSTPEGKALLRCYVGKPGGEEIVNKPDEYIVDVVLKDLNRVMSVHGQPEHFKVTRWHQAMPQYEIHHKKHLESLRERLENVFPGVILSGAAFEGVGLPDCITQGEEAAHKSLTTIKNLQT